MQKYFLIILIFSVSFSISAQKGFQKELDSVTTVQKAQRFINSIDGRKNKIITFPKKKKNTNMNKQALDVHIRTKKKTF